ncbi:MAG: hypothetical protein U1E25_12360 [Methylocystis sp.]
MRHGEVENEIVQRLGGHAGFDMFDEHVERLGGQLAGGAMPSKSLGLCSLICPLPWAAGARDSIKVI